LVGVLRAVEMCLSVGQVKAIAVALANDLKASRAEQKR
jgi:hypothetical protein